MLTEKVSSGDPDFEMVSWPIMDVHSILAWLWNDAGLEIPDDALENFWKTSRENRETWALLSDATSDFVPIGLYGDGATIQLQIGTASVIGIWLNLPLWRPKTIRFSRMLLCSVPESRLFKHYTLNSIYRRIVWSCNVAYVGVHPHTDQSGNQLPPHLAALSGQAICKARFTVTEIRGDWSWQLKVMRFDASWASTNCCWQCPATQTGPHTDRYYNFYGDASWENKTFNFAEFMAVKMPEDGLCHSNEFALFICGVGGRQPCQSCILTLL